MQQEKLNVVDSIRTFSGVYINVFNPTEDMINIEDIAHGLSNLCRFGGHLSEFYSVAQHSVLCSELLESREDKLSALMHDASESYILDVPTPIKKKLQNYKEIETNLMNIISNKFGFEFPLSEKIKQADSFMLQWEWERLMLRKEYHREIICWSPKYAKERFIAEFNNLK